MKLYPHQVDALKQTEGKNLVAYYLDMGLGKTFVGAEKMIDLCSTFNLVVCQKSKIQDWIDHFNQYYSEFPYFTEVYDLTNKKQLDRFMKVVNGYKSYMEMYEDLMGEPCEPYLQENPDPCQYIGVINYDLIF